MGVELVRVRGGGLEPPPSIRGLAPQASASAYSATRANRLNRSTQPSSVANQRTHPISDGDHGTRAPFAGWYGWAMHQPRINADAWLDLGSLDCYLALHALRSALIEVPFGRSVTVTPRPFLRSRKHGLTVKTEMPSFSDDVTKMTQTEGIRPNLAAQLPTSTKAAQQLVLQAVQWDEESGTAAGPDSLALRLSEAIMRALFEVGSDIQSPETLVAIAQDLHVGGKQSLQATEDEYLGIQVEQAYELGLYLGVAQPPVLTLDETFVVEGAQTKAAYVNILNAVWQERIEVGEDYDA